MRCLTNGEADPLHRGWIASRCWRKPRSKERQQVGADEVALIARLRAGDERAFDDVVTRFYPSMLAVAEEVLRIVANTAQTRGLREARVVPVSSLGSEASAAGPAPMGFIAARMAEAIGGVDAYVAERARQSAWLAERLDVD